MNRAGLLVALAIAATAGLVFGISPDLDILIAHQFFDPATKLFMLKNWIFWLREASLWFVTALVLVPVGAVVLKLLRPNARLLVPGRAVVFLTASLALGPGLYVNVILKEHWGRSRPIDVPQFAGTERFLPWWDPRGNCPKNCSFVSGDASGTFWTLAPAALAPPVWRPLAYGAAIAFGAFVGVLRMALGAHFFTDIVFAGVFTFLIVWIVHGLIYRWPRTRLDDETIERDLERPAKHLHKARVWIAEALGAWFRGTKDRKRKMD
jgi:membrane-associated PAP2 superfamily phosphatase